MEVIKILSDIGDSAIPPISPPQLLPLHPLYPYCPLELITPSIINWLETFNLIAPPPSPPLKLL